MGRETIKGRKDSLLEFNGELIVEVRLPVVERNLCLACQMEEVGVEFRKGLCGLHGKTTIVLSSIFNFERIEIDICEIIDHLLCGLERVFVSAVFSMEMCLGISSGPSEDIDHFCLLGGKVVVIHDEFAFDLDLPVLEGGILAVG